MPVAKLVSAMADKTTHVPVVLQGVYRYTVIQQNRGSLKPVHRDALYTIYRFNPLDMMAR